MANIECIDASSDYCPCYLAEVGECLTCSLLQGEAFCNCRWTGTCIFQEYAWSGFRARSKRETILCEVMERKITDDLLILTLKVPQRMAKSLEEPGSYIFLRGHSSLSFFDVPLAVMYINQMEKSIKLAIQIKGPKTKFLKNSNSLMYLRGPYQNGLFGLKQIKQTYRSGCLVILSGVAQTSGVSVIDELLKNGNEVTLVIDRSYPFFVREYISKDIKIYEEDLSSERGEKLLKDLISDENIRLIYTGGHSELQRQILEFALLYNPAAYLAFSNNSRLCCGEGICGSCELAVKGQKVRGCKAQFDVRGGYDG